MKPNMILKRVIDLLMILLLFIAMAYMLTGQKVHEWNGTVLCLLFLLHSLLNIGWFKSLLRGKYPPFRLFQAVLNILLLVCVVSLFVSGVMMSGYVFAWLPIHGRMLFARNLHMAAAYWGFALMSMHLGIHWGMIMKLAGRAAHVQSPSEARTVILRVLAGISALYGTYVFIKNDMLSYMLLKSQFVFFDYEQPVILFLLEYMAMMALWIFISYYGSLWLKGRTAKSIK